MKKLVIAIIILSVILTAGILESVYIDKIFEQLDDRLLQLEEYIKIEDEQKSLDATRNMTAWWEKKRNFIEMFAFSPDIRAFSVALGETEGSLECGDFDNAMSKCQSLIVMSKNIHRILDFNAEDII